MTEIFRTRPLKSWVRVRVGDRVRVRVRDLPHAPVEVLRVRCMCSAVYVQCGRSVDADVCARVCAVCITVCAQVYAVYTCLRELAVAVHLRRHGLQPLLLRALVIAELDVAQVG